MLLVSLPVWEHWMACLLLLPLAEMTVVVQPAVILMS
jgi:hypothetical protein